MKQLSLVEKAFFLKKHSLFNALDIDLLIAIGDKMNQDIYDPNEKVFEIDQRATKMYLVVSGKVALFDDKDNKITELKSEDFFGEEALFNEKNRSYMAICKTKTLFLTLSKATLITIISECPMISISLLEHFAKTISCRHKINEN